jgi:hypothetical protein
MKLILGMFFFSANIIQQVMIFDFETDYIQCDQKSKRKQIRAGVANYRSCRSGIHANKRSMHGRRQVMVSNATL